MPWDIFCPECSNILACSMTDEEEEMEKEMSEYDGKVLFCSHCDKYFKDDVEVKGE